MKFEIKKEKYLTQDKKQRERYVLIKWLKKPIHARVIGKRNTRKQIEELKEVWEKYPEVWGIDDKS